MFRAKLVWMVALALALVQLQCVAACAAQTCDTKTQSAPPCHGQRGPSSCPSQTVVTATPAPEISQLDIPVFSALSPAPPLLIGIPTNSRTNAPNYSASSPPELQRLSSVVLRI